MKIVPKVFFDYSSLAADSDQLYERNPYEIHPQLFADLSDLFSPCRLRDGRKNKWRIKDLRKILFPEVFLAGL
jgi:hypothetical protein